MHSDVIIITTIMVLVIISKATSQPPLLEAQPAIPSPH